MKKAISALTFLGFVLANNLNIQVESRWANNLTSYVLSCGGAQGQVQYYVSGLPNGVQFDGSSIVVSNAAALGNWSIRIRAVDQAGQQAERVITLQISQRAAGSTAASTAGSVAGSTAGSVAGSTAGTASSSTTTTTSTTVVTGGAGSGRLSELLGNLGGAPSAPRPDYGPSGRFPSVSLPTGADPNLPNFQTTLIASTQAQPTPVNRNPITADDVRLRAASDRHQNAIKGITNLLKIIDQARANRDQAQNDIQVYTQAFNDAVAGQRGAQNDVISAQTRTAQITSAITTLTTTIDDLRNRIAQAVAQNDALTRERQGVVDAITANEGARAALLDRLKGLDTQVAARVKELSDKNVECQSLNDAVNNKAKQLAAREQQLSNANAARPGLVDDVTAKTGVVDDLRNRLLQAERALADAKIKLADLDNLRLQLPVRISTLRQELDELNARARACSEQAARIQALINGLKGDKYPEITRQINDLDGKISASRTRVTEIDNALAGAAGPLADLRSKLTQAQDDLTFIRSQRTGSEDALRAAYQRGNDANNRVAFARQNLDAVVKRFQDESRIVSDATLNLESARAEQALARQGLNEFIAHYTDALPEVIVPNGNLLTNPGTPYGNNPSGSPLGAVRRDGNGAPGSFRINNWVNYLSSAYGAGVSPAFIESVNELYPFNFLSGVSGNMSHGTNVENSVQIRRRGCGGNSGRVTSGVVVEVRADSFDVRADDGQVTSVAVAPCTQLNAVVPNYQLSTGAKAIVKGSAGSQSGWINADLVTCGK